MLGLLILDFSSALVKAIWAQVRQRTQKQRPAAVTAAGLCFFLSGLKDQLSSEGAVMRCVERKRPASRFSPLI